MGKTENYKKKLEQNEERRMEQRQEGETDLDYRMRSDAAREIRNSEEQSKLKNESEASQAKIRDAEEKDKKINLAYEAGFTGETERHLAIRHKLYGITEDKQHDIGWGKRKFDPGLLEEERQALRIEYHQTPYEMPYHPVFRKTITYEADNGLQIISRDGGRSWSVRADSNYFKSTPRLEVDPVTKKPIGYIFELFNDSIYDFKKAAQPARVNIRLEEDIPKPEPVKTISRPKPAPSYCPDGFHKFMVGTDGVSRCVLCGKVARKDEGTEQ